MQRTLWASCWGADAGTGVWNTVKPIGKEALFWHEEIVAVNTVEIVPIGIPIS